MGWYPETALCTKAQKLQIQAVIRQKDLLWSWVHNPDLRSQTRINCDGWMCLRVKFVFYLSACSSLASTHTTQRGAEFFPGAAPLMSATTWAPGSGDALRWCVSKAAATNRRKQRPNVDTRGKYKICCNMHVFLLCAGMIHPELSILQASCHWDKNCMRGTWLETRHHVITQIKLQINKV